MNQSMAIIRISSCMSICISILWNKNGDFKNTPVALHTTHENAHMHMEHH